MTSGRLDLQSVLNQVERPLVRALVVSYDVQGSFGLHASNLCEELCRSIDGEVDTESLANATH
jgi:hypothetical protein